MRLEATGWILFTFTSGKGFFQLRWTSPKQLMWGGGVGWGWGGIESVSRPVDSVCLTALFRPVSARVFPQI